MSILMVSVRSDVSKSFVTHLVKMEPEFQSGMEHEGHYEDLI